MLRLLTALPMIAAALLAGGSARAAEYLVTNTNNSGAGSLRQAMEDAETNAFVSDTVEFNIPGAGPHVINLLSALPVCVDQVGINGYTEPSYIDGFPAIIINGSGVGDIGTACLDLAADACYVFGISIQNYPGNAIVLHGDVNDVKGCWIGVNSTGTGGAGNTANSRGITLFGSDNTIGFSDLPSRNVICLGQSAIRLDGANANNNWIRGNWIGVLPDASVADFGPSFTGIQLLNGPSNNHIGDAFPGEGNVISGCGFPAITISSPTFGAPLCDSNIIVNNKVGTDPTGTAAISNNGGLLISDGTNTVVGAFGPDGRNIFSGQSGIGSVIDLVGDECAFNVISNNYIGVDVTGNAILANGGPGIIMSQGAHHNIVGGSGDTERNVIAGNAYGVAFTLGAHLNKVTSNYIGLAADGVTELGNTNIGVAIVDLETTGNVVGGDHDNLRNIIAGSAVGVMLVPENSRNAVLGNIIRNNAQLGIDRSDNVTTGVTPNDVNDVDGTQNFPVITSAVSNGTSVTITGTMNSVPDTDIQLEFFANPSLDPLGAGEGARQLVYSYDIDFFYEEYIVHTDLSGNASFTVTIHAPGVPTSACISATATSEALGTSEFSYSALAPVTVSAFALE